MTKRRAPSVPLEHDEQVAFIKWVRLQYPDLLVWANANGGKRAKRTAILLKLEGVLAGVLDMTVARARGIYHGMYIEMKRRKGGSVSDEQKSMIAALRKEGYHCVVAKGWEEAAQRLREYMELGEPIYGKADIQTV
ncbi:VRR-NUC domain-containing protein [Burkholderia multivorans]|uniref:VRR-NUC domain-containing protein n=1 Tax=Burkholderia multivorans TaxID=87883 RepID=UPI001C21691D|nr:VRR-NUC domain-containing protein [Burkholderia multivorans]MBU9632082.1 VRR-NUC domain-containing protein [Burkholderia multivorans]